MASVSLFLSNFIHLFYPNYCLHCDERVERPSQPLCCSCFSQIELIDRKERCSRCWGSHLCKKCIPLHPHRSLFTSCGPVFPLFQEFQKRKKAQLLASLLIIALSQTNWPHPECIVPVTEGPFHKRESAFLLGAKAAELYQCRCFPFNAKVRDRITFLLIDRLYDTSQLLDARSKLRGFFPRKIYTIAFIDDR